MIVFNWLIMMEGVNVPILKLFHLELDYYQKIIYSENYTKNVF